MSNKYYLPDGKIAVSMTENQFYNLKMFQGLNLSANTLQNLWSSQVQFSPALQGALGAYSGSGRSLNVMLNSSQGMTNPVNGSISLGDNVIGYTQLSDGTYAVDPANFIGALSHELGHFSDLTSFYAGLNAGTLTGRVDACITDEHIKRGQSHLSIAGYPGAN
jgi:hypothetical protein